MIQLFQVIDREEEEGVVESEVYEEQGGLPEDGETDVTPNLLISKYLG